MGERYTHYYGLSDQAEDWLDKNCKKEYFKHTIQPVDSDGNDMPNEPAKVVTTTNVLSTHTGNKVFGMFEDDVYDLDKYTMNDGREVEEYLQAEPWSSGPCLFIALQYSDTKEPIHETLWPDKEIGNA